MRICISTIYKHYKYLDNSVTAREFRKTAAEVSQASLCLSVSHTDTPTHRELTKYIKQRSDSKIIDNNLEELKGLQREL